MQQAEFNLTESMRLRDAGIKQVADNNSHFLEVARDTARICCELRYEITMDDIRKQCPLEPLHPNAWGSVLRHKDFIFTGKYRKSELTSNHARDIKVWRLRA